MRHATRHTRSLVVMACLFTLALLLLLADGGYPSLTSPGTTEMVGVQAAAASQGTDPVEEWVVRYDGPADDYDHPYDIAVDKSGNVYVTGESKGFDTRDDYATIKYGPDGSEQWVARYDGPVSRYDAAWALAIDGSGNVYVTGYSQVTVSLTGTDFDYTTVKYGPNGSEQWVARYDGFSAKDRATAMAVDGSGNVYVTGYSEGPGTRYDYATIKYGPDGSEQWVARYDGPASRYDQPSALAVDESGNVYVTGGSTSDPEGNGGYATIKYGSDGSEQWVARYDGPVGSDYAWDLAVDGSGNVYVTGVSVGSGTDHDYATVKYGSDGSEQWVARYDGPVSLYDSALALAVDRWGNVYVTGHSDGLGTGDDYATIKYGPDGSEQWVARYDGPPSGMDRPFALAVDGSGNVYVTGTSYGLETSADCATIKYGPDGSEQWVARYDGPVSDYDSGTALAVDGSGNVYVTGASEGSGTADDYATIKYSHREEICDDGMDNDGDTLVDCDDPDCYGDPACEEAEICDDGMDNDGDTLVDCDDPDCVGDPACEEVQEVDLSVETTDSSNEPERVFKSGDDVFIRVVLRNIGDSTVTGDLKLEIRDENDQKMIEQLPSEHISVAPGELKVREAAWNSADHAGPWKSEGGFTFVGKKFRVAATFAGIASTFDFYVDEFGIPEYFRTLTYYSAGYWWEDILAEVKSEVDEGTDVREAWTAEWTRAVEYAQSLGTNVFDIGMQWYSWAYDESCTDCLWMPFPPDPFNVWPCIWNAKLLSYWFPADDGKNGHYSTPPMSRSILRVSFEDLGIKKDDLKTAREMIAEISTIAHKHKMKVAVYLDPIGIYDPDHGSGCSLQGNTKAEADGWGEKDASGKNTKRLNFSEILSINYATTASPYGNPPDGSANDHTLFSPEAIDDKLKGAENWGDEPSYHYYLVKQFRWLVENYNFDIFFVDDTGRLQMAGALPVARTALKLGSEQQCTTTLSRLEYPTDADYGAYDSPDANELKKELGSKSDDYFTLDSYANMLRHIRWQLKDAGDDKALISSDNFVPWPSMVASEDASSTDQFTSKIGPTQNEKGCHILWSEQTYDMGFKPMRPSHYRDPVNKLPINPGQQDPRVVAGWTWSNRGINLFDYEEFSPYEKPEDWDEKAQDLKRYLEMYNDHPDIFSDPNLSLDSVDRISIPPAVIGILTYSSPQRPTGKTIVIHTVQQKSNGDVVNDFKDVEDVRVKLPPRTETDVIEVKLLTGDEYSDKIETALTADTDWTRCDSQGLKDAAGEFLCIDIPVKIYSVVVVDIQNGLTVSKWNQVCYPGSEQPIEDVVSAGVQAVYRLAPGGGFQRWFPGRPEVSNIVTLNPYDALFVLMTDSASWIPEPSGTPPASVNLAQGWSSTCYVGSPEPPEDATSSIAEDLAVLYALGSDQTWGRYVPGRPGLTNISLIDRYSAVLVLVTGDTTWAMPGVSDHATPSPTPTPSPSPTPSPTPTPTPTPTAAPSPTETPTPSPMPTPSSYTGTLTVDRGTGATYLGGEEITICYSLSPQTPFHFKLFKKPEGESWTLVDQWDDDGTGWCFASTVSPAELGRKDLRAEFWISGQKVAEASTYILVVAA